MRFQYPIYGETPRVYSRYGITLSETVYPPRQSIPLHTHDEHAYFNLVLRGGYSEYDRKRRHECGKLAVNFHPPGVAHSNQFYDHETRLFHIRIDASLLDQMSGATVIDAPRYFRPGLLTS